MNVTEKKLFKCDSEEKFLDLFDDNNTFSYSDERALACFLDEIGDDYNSDLMEKIINNIVENYKGKYTTKLFYYIVQYGSDTDAKLVANKLENRYRVSAYLWVDTCNDSYHKDPREIPEIAEAKDYYLDVINKETNFTDLNYFGDQFIYFAISRGLKKKVLEKIIDGTDHINSYSLSMALYNNLDVKLIKKMVDKYDSNGFIYDGHIKKAVISTFEIFKILIENKKIKKGIKKQTLLDYYNEKGGKDPNILKYINEKIESD